MASPFGWTRLTLLVVTAAALAAGALIGLAWTIGVPTVLHGLVHPHWIWFPAAIGGELLAYLGYTLAYREVARAERGAELDVPKAAALVATGFGVFVQGGGFALDREALQRAGLTEDEARRRVLGLGALEYAVLGPATGYALTRRALPLGGAGVVEALLPFALGWVRIALPPALLAVFAYRLINLWLPMIPALAGLPTLRRLGRPRRRTPRARRRAA